MWLILEEAVLELSHHQRCAALAGMWEAAGCTRLLLCISYDALVPCLGRVFESCWGRRLSIRLVRCSW
jgi:hypothetical protein